MQAWSQDSRNAAALLAAVICARVALAARWDLLADEAWYAAWSEHLAAGYYDQPPAIAWVLAAARAVHDSPLALRAIPLALGAAIPLILVEHARDRPLWLVWCAVLPPIGWLGAFATPDALLLGCWALGIAGAIRGGRGWVIAGIAAGLAFESKHTGALLLPLLMVGAREDLRSPWPWVGAAAALALAAPNLAWNAGHDWVTVRFQLGEGLLHPRPPGLVGPFLQLVGQALVATPIAALCGYVWAVRTAPHALDGSRVERIAWWTSAPLLLFFAVAALFGPPEAHWPAPAWIGVGLGLSYATGALARATWTGMGLAGILIGFAALHSWRPILNLPADPGTRMTEGPVLAGLVARIAAQDSGTAPVAVVTERYQEAAFIQYYAQIPAAVHPGCGRPGQQGQWPTPLAERALFVRPTTSGPPDCVLAEYRITRGPIPLEAADRYGRRVGPWQLFELERR